MRGHFTIYYKIRYGFCCYLHVTSQILLCNFYCKIHVCFKLSEGQSLKYSLNMLLNFYIVTPGPAVLIRTACKYSTVCCFLSPGSYHRYHIYLCPVFLQRLLWLYFEKAIRLSRDVLMYPASILLSFSSQAQCLGLYLLCSK